MASSLRVSRDSRGVGHRFDGRIRRSILQAIVRWESVPSLVSADVPRREIVAVHAPRDVARPCGFQLRVFDRTKAFPEGPPHPFDLI